MAQQHRDWSKLGFIRGIAVSPVMCCSLSTHQWVGLLLRVVRGSLPDDDSLPPTVSAAHLPRQVTFDLQSCYYCNNTVRTVFNIECRKIKTNHSSQSQQTQTIQLTNQNSKLRLVTIGFGFTSDWLRKWREML